MHEETREVTEEYIDWEETKKEGKVVKKKRTVIKPIKDLAKPRNIDDDCIIPEIVPNTSFYTSGKLFIGSLITLVCLTIALGFYCITQSVTVNNNFLMTNAICFAAYLVIMFTYFLIGKKIDKKVGIEAESILARSVIGLEIILANSWKLIIAIMFGNSVCFVVVLVTSIIMIIFSILMIAVPEIANGFLCLIAIICKLMEH